LVNGKFYLHEYAKEAEITNHTSEEGESMNTLYKVIETEEYGTFLTKDSQGKLVLELKGSNKVASFSSDELEEVVPYTIDIQFQTGGDIYTFTSEKGTLELGDLVVPYGRVYEGPYGRDIAQVTGVDTKNKKATKPFKGWKLQTQRIA
jgi:hypothetical protein